MPPKNKKDESASISDMTMGVDPATPEGGVADEIAIETDSAQEDALGEWEAELQARMEMLDAREAEINTRENVLREGEELKKTAPKGPPPKERKALRYMCVRQCYAPINPDNPATCKIYYPGERVTFYEDQKDRVSKHFKPIPNRSSEAEVKKEAETNEALTMPAFVTKFKKTEIEHG